jgi:hypothetical protein
VRLQFAVIEEEEGVKLYQVYSPCGIFSIWADSQKQVRESMKTRCEFHAVCISSDSNLPECKCWCAECKENKKGAN